MLGPSLDRASGKHNPATIGRVFLFHHGHLVQRRNDILWLDPGLLDNLRDGYLGRFMCQDAAADCSRPVCNVSPPA